MLDVFVVGGYSPDVRFVCAMATRSGRPAALMWWVLLSVFFWLHAVVGNAVGIGPAPPAPPDPAPPTELGLLAPLAEQARALTPHARTADPAGAPIPAPSAPGQPASHHGSDTDCLTVPPPHLAGLGLLLALLIVALLAIARMRHTRALAPARRRGKHLGERWSLRPRAGVALLTLICVLRP